MWGMRIKPAKPTGAPRPLLARRGGRDIKKFREATPGADGVVGLVQVKSLFWTLTHRPAWPGGAVRFEQNAVFLRL